jgi:hypothetical protein
MNRGRVVVNAHQPAPVGEPPVRVIPFVPNLFLGESFSSLLAHLPGYVAAFIGVRGVAGDVVRRVLLDANLEEDFQLPVVKEPDICQDRTKPASETQN